MPQVFLSPFAGAGAQFFDNNGVILSGGKVYTYAAGTTTPRTSYTSSSGTTAHANPIILDSAGRVPGGEIWLAVGLIYKFVVETSTGVLLGTYDNISGINSTVVNADIVVYDPPFTGGVATNVEAKLAQTVSVKDFGATGNGTTDDTAAIQAAFNSGAVAIYFPAGRYIVTADLTRSGNTYIYGDTLTSSILQMNGTASFIYTGGTAGSEYGTNQLQIERLGFECPTLTAKSVINAAWTDGVGGTSKTFIMRDCQITGTNAAGGFGNAVLLTNARNIVVESVRILGDRDGTPLSTSFGFNIIGTNPTGAPVEMFFNKVQVYFVDTAFKIDGWIEGVFFTSCTMIACHTGIDAVIGPAGPKPLINVIGCHINTDTFGIRTVGFVQSNYSDNLIYAQDVDGTSTGYTAISLNASGATLNVQVDNNNFQGLFAGVTQNGVVVENGLGNDFCIISNNIFNAFDVAVWFQAGTTDAIVADTNYFDSCAVNVLNQGAASNINGVFAVDGAGIGQKEFPDRLVQKFGSSAITLDASGDGTITLTPAFRTAFVGATVSSGDPSVTGGASTFSVRQANCTTSLLAVSVRPNPGAVPVRVNWFACGY
jgi:hypothetical protein